MMYLAKLTQLCTRHRWWLATLFAISIALGMFLPRFGTIPIGLNRDEVSLGYTAYSLFRTGHDEHGTYWPISILSFGDQKLPGYVYTLMPIVGIFGLSAVTIRSVSLLAGIAIVVAAGQLAKLLAADWKWSPAQQFWVGLVSMLVVAVSPWAMHFSHVAYEANLALAWFSWGLIAWFHARSTRSSPVQIRWYLLWAILWAASMLTYHSYHIVVPGMVLWLGIWEHRSWLKLPKTTIFGLLAVAIITISLMLGGQIWSANQKKSLGISPFNLDSLHRAAFPFRESLGPDTPAIVGKILANPASIAVSRLGQNLVRVIDGDFFFVFGTPQNDHNPGNMPLFQLFMAPAMLAGFLAIWDHRQKLSSRVWLGWLGAAILTPSLTIQPQHTTRFSPGFLVLSLMVGVGLITLWHVLQAVKLKWLPQFAHVCLGLFCLLVLWSTTLFWLQYQIITPQTTANHEADHLLAQTLARLTPLSPIVLTQSPQNSPYIWYLFETKYDPRKLPAHLSFYPGR